MKRYELHNCDNLEWLRMQPDNSVDSVVTDPPYGLGKEPDVLEVLRDWMENGYHEIGGKGFMGHEWDKFVPQPIFWREVWRVLKPGGHVVAFAGSRTYDWTVMALRLAGFEIRDQLMWIYGGGFPKSLDVSKQLDKKAGKMRDVLGIDEARNARLKNQVDGSTTLADWKIPKRSVEITAPSTDEAKQWEGWGTALSPSHEPIVLARKPLDGTVAANVLKWGTGAINIDGSRVGTDDTRAATYRMTSKGIKGGGMGSSRMNYSRDGVAGSECGRWPSNLIHDGSAEVLDLFPVNSNTSASSKPGDNSGSLSGRGFKGGREDMTGYDDQGSAARYFYCAKPSQYERKLGAGGMEGHPTVKAVDLCRHLVRLVTPPDGIILDPFCGSGSMGIGAMLAGERIRYIGLEIDAGYLELAKSRLKVWPKYRQFVEDRPGTPKARKKGGNGSPSQGKLF